jgi:hypothetical protein
MRSDIMIEYDATVAIFSTPAITPRSNETMRAIELGMLSFDGFAVGVGGHVPSKTC